MGDADQGIVHVVGPQLGLTQPGMTIVCGDTHTSTHGAFGALAFGIGTSEVEHVLATQTLPLKPFRTMAVTVDGELPAGVTAKDIVLAVIAKIGTGGGQGYVLEYRGQRHRGAVDGGPDDGVQHVDRGRRPGRHDRPRRDHLRLPPGPAARAARAPTGTPRSRTGAAAHRRRRRLRRRGRPRRGRRSRRSSPGAPTPARACRCRRAVPDPESYRRRDRPGRGRAGPGVHGPRGRARRCATSGRHRLRRLLHQRPDRGPARRRRGRQGPPGRRRRADARRARLGAGAAAGRGRGPGQGLHRGRRRVAAGRLLDVPRA